LDDAKYLYHEFLEVVISRIVKEYIGKVGMIIDDLMSG
jgi:hypothetical protein